MNSGTSFSYAGILSIAVLIGFFFLHIYLSRRENKFYGLIFPILSFVLSFIYTFYMIYNHQMTVMENIFQMIISWLLANIPTVILLAVYFVCRIKFQRGKQLNKMNIQDLE